MRMLIRVEQNKNGNLLNKNEYFVKDLFVLLSIKIYNKIDIDLNII